jgi:nicotinamidase/pyrazinamidase
LLISVSNVISGAKINRIFVVGLATDYCVRASVISALDEVSKLPAAEKWEVYVVKEAVRGVHPEREEEVLRELESRGARIVSIDGPELQSLRSEV